MIFSRSISPKSIYLIIIVIEFETSLESLFENLTSKMYKMTIYKIGDINIFISEIEFSHRIGRY